MARHFDIPVFYKSKIISGIKKARQEQDPQTGEEIKIKASKTIGFKPAPTLKSSL